MNIKVSLKQQILIFFAAVFLFATAVNAEAVRGRLDGNGPYGPYPVTGVPVTVFSPQFGRSTPSYSDYKGMFYIFNLRPGPHTLEIWLGGPQPMIFDIMVYPNQPMTDLAPIIVR